MKHTLRLLAATAVTYAFAVGACGGPDGGSAADGAGGAHGYENDSGAILGPSVPDAHAMPDGGDCACAPAEPEIVTVACDVQGPFGNGDMLAKLERPGVALEQLALVRAVGNSTSAWADNVHGATHSVLVTFVGDGIVYAVCSLATEVTFIIPG